MPRRRPKEKPLRRRVGTRVPRKTLLVFCEGARTEPEYLEALRRQPEVKDVAAVDIQIHAGSGGSAPLTLVRLAVEARRTAEEVDEVWCVFDVEAPKPHPRLREAVQLADENGVHVAVSNPCFELWLFLHFKDRSAALTTREACGLRKRQDKAIGKGLDPADYMPKRREAVARALALEARHQGSGTFFPKDNPSSGMHRLLASVEEPLVAE